MIILTLTGSSPLTKALLLWFKDHTDIKTYNLIISDEQLPESIRISLNVHLEIKQMIQNQTGSGLAAFGLSKRKLPLINTKWVAGLCDIKQCISVSEVLEQ